MFSNHDTWIMDMLNSEGKDVRAELGLRESWLLCYYCLTDVLLL